VGDVYCLRTQKETQKTTQMVRSVTKFALLSLLSLRMVLPLGSDVAFAATATPFAQASVAYQEQSVFPEQDFLLATNAARVAVNLPELTLNQQLTVAAQAKANDMLVNDYWAHFRPSDGTPPWFFISQAGYSYTIAGENLARGFSSVAGITKAWLASPTHRANLLSSKYKEVGFASVTTTDEQGNSIILTVQLFGTAK
jgi:uncharacterized protein YkwD